MCREIEKLREKTKIEERTRIVLILMEELKLTMEQAMDVLRIPESERDVLIARISN